VKEVFTDQSRELDGVAAEWEGLVKEGLGALARKSRELNLEDVVIPTGRTAR
jgi:hypothetical protein